MAGANTVKPDTHLLRGQNEHNHRPVPKPTRLVGSGENYPQAAETREGKAQVTNIIHVASKATIDYISQDPRGTAAVLALGVAVIVAKWVWNEWKGRKND